MNLRIWESLSAEDQALIEELAKESATMQRELWAESDAAAKEAVLAAGVTINEIADKAAFQNAMGPVYEMAYRQNPELQSLVELIQSID
jgi:TRAP-type C4-dicarboxylate transport system substrate-binding protein